ncbi:unnamed protein product [Amoebophrya sp. A25]|nr:unnamed protein product [Amoebophrya sp. A25]|eukprot:GSA25T00006250001.1
MGGCFSDMESHDRRRYRRQQDVVLMQPILNAQGQVVGHNQIAGRMDANGQIVTADGTPVAAGGQMPPASMSPQEGQQIFRPSAVSQGGPSAGMVAQPMPGMQQQGMVPQQMAPQQMQQQIKPPPALTGRCKALLVGINYRGTRAELRGCINDVQNVYRLLSETFKWKPDQIRVLTDDGNGTFGEYPTRQNIMAGLRWLSQGVTPGDCLFFLYSGHGAQKEDPHGYEEDGMNETILPCDFQRAGMITDDEMSDIICRPLPEGVRLTCLMDSCHSGTGLDLPWTWIPGRGWREDTNPFHTRGDVQSEDSQTSSDGGSYYGQRAGAMTTAFCEVMRATYPRGQALSYDQLLQELHKMMRRRGFTQRPQLTSSQAFGMDRLFIMDSIVMNSNTVYGRVFRRKFPPRPRPVDDKLADMLGLGMGIMGGLLLADMLL